jgi:hypothetical protein
LDKNSGIEKRVWFNLFSYKGIDYSGISGNNFKKYSKDLLKTLIYDKVPRFIIIFL